jgi:hypothetical protein
MQGAILFGTDARPRPARRIKLSELQKRGKTWRAGEGRGR